MKKRFSIVLIIVLAIAVIAGCSGGNNGNTNSPPSPANSQPPANSDASDPPANEPAPDSPVVNDAKATISIAWVADEAYADLMTKNEIIKEKFPNVTFEFHVVGDLEKMVTAKEQIDIINYGDDGFLQLDQWGLLGDLTESIQAANIDLGTYPPELIERLKKLGPNGELYALPEITNPGKTFWAMVYNKDIFDKFAVSYPTDGMTWDEVIELAKNFNRTDGGVQYRGVEMMLNFDYLMYSINPEFKVTDGKIDLSDPKWKQIFTTSKAAYEANGGWLPWPGYPNNWPVDKTTAMYVGVTTPMLHDSQNFPDLNWDVVTFPSFEKGKPTVPLFLGTFVVPPTSKNKELALQVIQAFNSPELVAQKPGTDKWDNEILKTKNQNGFTNIPPSPFLQTLDIQKSKIWDVMRPLMEEYLTKNVDVNTILQRAQEGLQKNYDLAQNQ
ncbi:ABC transporter substrate-binding protein [Paenibacillus nasutitermitis]|uniref:Extracellular solute-binding protein n=1 Tax=Paenibacillus nasutitermitis TaxID=1652958 RepID=A0A917DX22_9BACL|nr:extracellular solute-binding protein [Paenibacillus nasutitermitis]GGD79791.1 hypothetical protein GCM10010911_42360 [Paenibacillus nasutitermitis]